MQQFSKRSTSKICVGETQHQEILVKNYNSRKKLNITQRKQQQGHKSTPMQRVLCWCFYLFLLSALYQRIIDKQLLSCSTDFLRQITASPSPCLSLPVPNGQYQAGRTGIQGYTESNLKFSAPHFSSNEVLLKCQG